MKVTFDTQRVGSVLRQVLAIAGIVFGILTQSVSSLHLPPAVSSIMLIAGSVLVAIEHYVSDPSTGTTNAPSPVAISTTAPVTTTTPPA